MTEEEKLIEVKDRLIEEINKLDENELLDFVWKLRNHFADNVPEDESEEDKIERKKLINVCNRILNNE